jgi:hypothetical protein
MGWNIWMEVESNGMEYLDGHGDKCAGIFGVNWSGIFGWSW